MTESVNKSEVKQEFDQMTLKWPFFGSQTMARRPKRHLKVPATPKLSPPVVRLYMFGRGIIGD